MSENEITAASNAHEFTVSQISRAVKSSIEENFGHVRVRGEVGRLSRPGSGHLYFDLKDEKSVLAAVAWKGVASRWRFQPEQGLEVIVSGRLTTFAGQSKYQIIVENVEPAGAGALMALLEERRRKLAAEGLFDENRKRSLPFLPGVIGVVTSPSGAVIRDILHRLEERFPTHVIVWPVRVQGTASAMEVANAIRGFDTLPSDGPVPRPDLVIVARGGGSLEDLWGFNEEEVVRAIARSSIPLISAVGHETDITLADFAADRRAPTPTAAAEMAVPVRSELVGRLNDLGGRKYAGMSRTFSWFRDRLRAMAARLPGTDDLVGQPRQRLDMAGTRLGAALFAARQAKALALAGIAPRLSGRLLKNLLSDQRLYLASIGERSVLALSNKTGNSVLHLQRPSDRLAPAMANIISRGRQRLLQDAKLLNSLGYRNVLERGFVMVMDREQRLVKTGASLSSGDLVSLRFADCEREAVIDGRSKPLPGDPGRDFSGAGKKTGRDVSGSPERKPRRKPKNRDHGQTSLF